MNKKIKHFFKKLGPGFITGASDDDPSGIATYTQTGAQFGYQQSWTALFSFPFMTAVQEMCGRIGLVTGRGLAGVMCKYYNKKILFFSVFLLLVANTINIGANLGAMAAAAQLLVPLPFGMLLFFFTAITLYLEVFVKYKKYVNYLKYFAMTLLAYVATAFVVRVDWGMVWQSVFSPNIQWSEALVMNIVAVLGTTISPYLFFWQTDEEVEEEIAAHKLKDFATGKPKITHRDIRRMRGDTVFGMFFSNLIMFFIIVTAGATLAVHGITNIETAADAAAALKPLAGEFASLLFTLGIIGTGMLGVPVLAGGASYAVSESLKWKEGLSRPFSKAHGFYSVIVLATLVGLLVNFIGIPPFKMLYYTAIVNGAVSPILLFVILMIANNKKVMGQYTNSALSNVLGWSIAVIMSAASLVLLFNLIK